MSVLVIGAGASGLGAAAKLLERGIRDVVVLDKGDDVGGTWRDNTYPGCACDVPSALYSYSFAPNPSWTRLFAGQAEIRAYLRETARRAGVLPHVRLGVEVRRAQWDESHRRWEVSTSAGTHHAQALIGAAGPWHEPLVPELPGLEAFPGEAFHSSRWRHDVDLTGKRVVVVGTGASAVQFIPRIQPSVGQLHVFQRTAQWVLPKLDAPMPAAVRSLLGRSPAALRGLRALEYALLESLGLGFRHPWLMRGIQQLGTANLFAAVRDPALRATLRPTYTLGCKRLLMSNDYYPALARPNVTVHAGAVREVRGRSVIGADGTSVEADVVIFGTGFHILDMPIAARVFDAGGCSLEEHWQGSPQAYLGTTVAGFPNLFLTLGPGLGTGHTSAFMIMEAQLEHTVAALAAMRRNGWETIEVRRDVQARFNERLQAALPSTVYNSGGCSSYYLDVNGRNSFSWPWSTRRLREEVTRFDSGDYVVRSPAPVLP